MLLNSIVKIITKSKLSPIAALVLAIGSFLSQACSPFSGAVNEAVSNNYYYGKFKKDIRYSPMGNWFSLGNNKVNADVASFTPLARDYGKDKDHIFYKENMIDNEVDMPSFRAKDAMAFDKNHVYIATDDLPFSFTDNLNIKTTLFIVAGADPETYQRLEDWSWGKDAKNWFYYYKRLDVDYESFTPINSNFCKDEHRVYIKKSFEIIPCNIEAKTFKSLNDRYVADAKFIYDFVGWENGKEVNKLNKFSYEDFNSVDATDKDYLLFDNQVLYDGNIVEDADRAHFKVIESPTRSYATNDQFVFCYGKKIVGADLETFKLYDYAAYARDKNHVYFWGEKMEGVDIESFGPKEKGGWIYSDKNHDYMGTEIRKDD